jgi:hypothetical protein
MSFPGYFLFHVMPVIMLLSVGLWACAARLNDRRVLVLMGAALLFVVWLDWNHASKAVTMAWGGGILLAIGFWKYKQMGDQQTVPAALLIIGLALINLPTNYKLDRHVQDLGYFAQAKYLRDHYGPMSPVFAHPGVATVSANMWWIQTWADLAKVKSKEDFLAMMELVSMPVIATDPLLKSHNIYGSGAMIDKYAPEYYRTVWHSKNGQYKILQPKNLSKSKVKLLPAPVK